MSWDAHGAYLGVFMILGRIPLENHVAAIGSNPLKTADVEQHLRHVVARKVA